MRTLFAALVAFSLLGSGSAFAAAAAPAAAPTPSAPQPTPEALQTVWNYFEHGKGGGPVLGDAKLCLEIGKSGDQKSECTQEVPADGVKAGTVVYVWQAYMVPSGDEVGDLSLQVKQGETVRETKDIPIIKGTFWRERTWSGTTLRKPGTWTLSIMRGDKVLKSFTVKVS